MKKRLVLLGSTGSIGTQALDVVRAHSDRFEVVALTANNSVDLLILQAIEFLPKVVVIANELKYQKVKDALTAMPIEVLAGEEALRAVATMPEADMVLTAMVGFSGLLPTIDAIKAGKHIALANKETLVVAGEIVTELARKHGVKLLPVDSEHSAIFQCLMGETDGVEKLILTASGGPFRSWKAEELKKVTRADALKHPNWCMGNKITIDSATLMNKGFEVIEARWLFGIEADRIDVVVHPQSIIHSMVQFVDGSIKAQLGIPDMKLPIQLAFAYPERLSLGSDRFDFFACGGFTFEKPDLLRFPCLRLAYEALDKGGNSSCILNAANEIAVQAFLEEKIHFLDIPRIVEQSLHQIEFVKNPSIDDYCLTDAETRAFALTCITKN
ncbi:1-deoxy-D-xylulose-5-phosphate reductoisomerase [Williamwhitmania taraxaci]|uniref:1-deoxy-D-xylulose 5-phosphate reductoisomerase n=1 Tax=Williamwhitmania taraxaci TaxID=1640674 RepID=A0A1G6R042_9BACT|nr:1-deoxy-D-xylulose-5-phosphate reductoisomerase [Williamwhitmania taraxaci]SDC97972.1 1-deoxy-D-xylulose 5-phosphate reductoisomerase [Williamwhitmania taraxaci]